MLRAGTLTTLVEILAVFTGSLVWSATFAFAGTDDYGGYPIMSSPKLSDSPYFDLTDALNSPNYTEIQYALNITSNIYYSTDLLVSELPKLYLVAEFLDMYLSQINSSEKVCLMISFQITNSTLDDIDWRHMEDLIDTDDRLNATDISDDNLKILNKYLCKVLLNFQINNLKENNAYAISQSYARKWDISFTKYAKETIASIFGAETRAPTKVGVLYSEHQLDEKDEYLSEQEITNADFLIINATFSPGPKMPLTYFHFVDGLQNITIKNEDYVSNYTTVPSSLMLTWNEQYIASCAGSYGCYTDWTEMAVFNSSLPAYKQLLQSFVSWTKSGYPFTIDVISGTKFEIQNQYESLGASTKSSQVLAPVYVQKSDATPCQLRSMLDQVSRSFDTLVVNEFSWNALVSNFDKISNVDHTTTCNAFIIEAPEFPQETIMFASEGIGHLWNKTSNSFKRLIWEHSNLGPMNLSTVVFSSQDVISSNFASGSANSNDSTGIDQFALELVEGNKTKVGCLIDVTDLLRHYSTGLFFRRVVDQCQLIYQNSTLLVWKYQLDVISLWEFYQSNSNSMLFSLLRARALFSYYNPDKEVIFIIEPPNQSSSRSAKSHMNDRYLAYYEMEFKMTLFSWAKVHGVKIMYKPAYNMKYPQQGYFTPPLKDGSFGYTNGFVQGF